MTKFSESESVLLKTSEPRPVRELWRLLRRLGFTRDEDVFVFQRAGRIPPWQHDSSVEIDILSGGVEVFDPRGTWDSVRSVFLLSRLPESSIDEFAIKTAELAVALGSSMELDGSTVTAAELKERLVNRADELSKTLGRPGSEELAILIESSHPK